jgi:hypothetical protein
MKASSSAVTSMKGHCLKDFELKVEMIQDLAVLPMDQVLST